MNKFFPLYWNKQYFGSFVILSTTPHFAASDASEVCTSDASQACTGDAIQRVKGLWFRL